MRNLKNLDFGYVASSKAVIAPAPVLPVHVSLFKELGLPEVILNNITTVTAVGLQLGALGSGFQTQRGFTQLYGVDLQKLLESFEKGENLVCDAMAMRTAMISCPDHKGMFYINLLGSQKTLVEVSTLEKGFFNIRFSFNLIYDDSVITGNPNAMCNMISRPLNLEVCIYVDVKQLNADLAAMEETEEKKEVVVENVTTEEKKEDTVNEKQ